LDFARKEIFKPERTESKELIRS
jgi:hypothetical protein